MSKARTAVLFLAALTCTGQSQSTDPPIFRTTVPLALVDVMAIDPKTGRSVGGLTTSDFALAENGETQTITYFSRDELPLSIVLMFDLTDTVRPVLKTLGDGASDLLTHLKPQDEVAVMTFSSTAQLIGGFTTVRSQTEEAIRRVTTMQSREATFLDESMFQVANETLKAAQPGTRRAIICLTDGTVNLPSDANRKNYGQSVPPGPLYTTDQAMKTLLESGASLNAVIEPSGENHPWDLPAANVHDYAETSGGITVTAGKRDIRDKLASMLDAMRGRYTIGYRPSRDVAPGTFCRIVVRLTADAAKRAGNPAIRAKFGYYR